MSGERWNIEATPPYEIAARIVDETGEPPPHDRMAHGYLPEATAPALADGATSGPDACPRCAWNVAQAERATDPGTYTGWDGREYEHGDRP